MSNSASAFLKTLPAAISPAEKTHLENYYNSMPSAMRVIIDQAALITAASQDTIKKSIGLIDHTSLKEGATPMLGIETPEEIIKLCEAAKGKNGYPTAAVCVYPNQIEIAKKALAGSGVKLAVVNNFPHGNMTTEDAVADAAAAATRDIDEDDTVIDYAQFLQGHHDVVREKLTSVAHAIHAGGAQLKIILKASVYQTYDELYDAAVVAIECGADFVKTCTGKVPLAGYGTDKADVSTLLTAATIMKAVADQKASHPAVGVKISGGVKTPAECEQMRYLVDQILGSDYYRPDRFRFGASSLLANLNPEAPAVSPTALPNPAPGAY